MISLRKRAPEPDPDDADEPVDELQDEPEQDAQQPLGWAAALLLGVRGPADWLAAKLGTGTAWTVHAVAVWACIFYGGWTAAAIVLVWLAAVGLFVPREYLDRLAGALERHGQDQEAEPDELVGDTVQETAAGPDPQDVVDLVRDLIGDDRGLLLTALREPLHVADTRAVREVLQMAGIRVRPGVRTAAGNGPGIHRDDLPALLPSPGPSPDAVVVAGETANNNTNRGFRVQSREGMTIINDPADRYRTHTIGRP